MAMEALPGGRNERCELHGLKSAKALHRAGGTCDTSKRALKRDAAISYTARTAASPSSSAHPLYHRPPR